ncbi:MAG: hypothetical protein ACM3ZV_04645 [Bacillota bacterium]
MKHAPALLDDADQLTHPPRLHEGGVFGDIPGSIWVAFLSAWALLFALFLFFFTGDGPAKLAVVTASFFALMTLGLPAAIGGHRGGAPKRSPRVIMTLTGLIPTREAATQILLIPVGAVFGIVAFIILAL